jgi:hypothetical protein
MDQTGLVDTKDSISRAEDSDTTGAWHEEARAWMSRRPEESAANSTKCGDYREEMVKTKVENPETPEVKAAYKALLEKTRGADPVVVSDCLNLFGDLAVSGSDVSRFKNNSQANRPSNARTEQDNTFNPLTVEPGVSNAYARLLQKGLKPVVIVDVLNVAGDLGAIATSPEGRKLFQDVKALVSHLKG